MVSFPGPYQASLQCCNKRWAEPGNEADNISELEWFSVKNLITTKCKVQSLTNINQSLMCSVNTHIYVK